MNEPVKAYDVFMVYWIQSVTQAGL